MPLAVEAAIHAENAMVERVGSLVVPRVEVVPRQLRQAGRELGVTESPGTAYSRTASSATRMASS